MLAGPAQRDCFEVFLAVVFPHDAGHDRGLEGVEMGRPPGAAAA
jgi:hypothetical protein